MSQALEAAVNALDLIKTDHDKMKYLLEEALDTDEPGERVDLLHESRNQLMAHERMEEDVFYPAPQNKTTQNAQSFCSQVLFWLVSFFVLSARR
jgi:hypothetical protein